MIQAYEHKAATWKALYVSLVQQNKLTPSQQRSVDTTLQEVLLQRLPSYQRKRSTSMPVKQFKHLQKGMFYTLDHALPDTRQETFFFETSIAEQLRIGEANINARIDHITSLWLSCRSHALPFHNERYLSIINEQIPKFLHAYDATYLPHQCLQDLDYPLWDGLAMDHDMYGKKGCDVVLEYLTRYSLEQRYALLFQTQLPEVFQAYETIHDVSIAYVGLNLTNLLLPIHLCSLCLPQTTLIIAKDAFAYVKQHFTRYTQKDWESLIHRMKSQLSKELFQYLEPAIKQAIDTIKQAIEEGWFSILLLQEDGDTRQEFLIQNNATTMDFEQLLDEISEEPSLKNKIDIIRNAQLSIHDIIDLFEHDIFFADEFDAYYSQCIHLEIAVLLYLCKSEEFVFHQHPTKESVKNWVGEMSWQSSLYHYVSSQNDAYWDALTTIFTTIKFHNAG